MRVLATGGAGYVGSATVRNLLEQGHEVIAYDNLSKGFAQAIPHRCLIKGDLGDYGHLLEVLREEHIEAVIHFAGYIAVGESVVKPKEYYHNNIGNSLVLLEAIQAAGIKKLVFSSTAAVYDAVTEGSLNEDSAKAPASPYAFSKYAVERLIEDFSRAYGMGYTILRYFNACGASPDGNYGEAHDPETHLIPLVLQVPLGQRENIGVFGKDYDTPDGTCIRDYVHVDDLAAAHILAIRATEPGSSRICNIGTGTGKSVLEVIRTAQEVVQQEIPMEFLPRRAGDTTRLVASSDRIREDLGWEPKYNKLHDIIATAWAWHKTHPEGY